MLLESSSPAHLGTAVFLINGGSFAGSDTYFFVRDAARPSANPLRIGGDYASDGPIKFQQAVWSQDGSVIAARVKVGASAGKGFSRYDGAFWINAYDFRKRQDVSEGVNIHERSKAIERLLAGRGGIGPLTLSELSQHARAAGWEEARRFDTSRENNNKFR